MVVLQAEEIRSAVQAALAEDVGVGDVTTQATVPEGVRATAHLRTRQPMTVAGLDFAEAAFRLLSETIEIRRLSADSDRCLKGALLMEAAGDIRSILSAERVALNFVQRLSGVATLTARFVEAVRGTSARILDTRKTTPGWRRFEKYAVACGGGVNHRFGLFDRVLIKDNHLAALRRATPDPITAAVRRARSAWPELKVEVEADRLDQVALAVDAGADFILLDNMTHEQLHEAVRIVAGRCQVEASGGVSLDTVRAIAETGVDFISVGAITHSAPAADVGLDFPD